MSSSVHPREELSLIALGHVPSARALSHLGECGECARVALRDVPVDLEGALAGVLAEIHAPRPVLAERILSRLGVPSWLCRSLVITPALRGAWLGCSCVVLVLAALVGSVNAGRGTQVSAILVLAPCVVAAAVGYCYGPRIDPAYELARVTPCSQAMIVLARTTAVIAVNCAIVEVASVLGPRPGPALAWFPSMAAVSLLAQVLALRTRPMVGVGCGLIAWIGAVVLVCGVVPRPVDALWGAFAQESYGLVALVCGVLLYRLVRSDRAITPASRLA